MVQRIPLSPKGRYRVLQRDNFSCRLCGMAADKVRLEVDHIIPVSNGGDNTFYNLWTLCFNCNRGKYISTLVMNHPNLVHSILIKNYIYRALVGKETYDEVLESYYLDPAACQYVKYADCNGILNLEYSTDFYHVYSCGLCDTLIKKRVDDDVIFTELVSSTSFERELLPRGGYRQSAPPENYVPSVRVKELLQKSNEVITDVKENPELNIDTVGLLAAIEAFETDGGDFTQEEIDQKIAEVVDIPPEELTAVLEAIEASANEPSIPHSEVKAKWVRLRPPK